MKTPRHTTVVAYLALVLALGGTAEAANGAGLLLGRPNAATTTTVISDPHGIPLSLVAKPGQPALHVNTTAKVPHLNSDLLDGLDAGQFQRATSATCAAGTAVKSITAAGQALCTTYQTITAPLIYSGLSGSFADCPAGASVVGGGYALDDAASSDVSRYVVTESLPEGSHTDLQGWYVKTNQVATNGNIFIAAITGTVYAICVS